jgi:ribosomal protein RSM22 (predicted rRNA methylase)
MIELPADLHDAIARVLAATPAARWVRAAQALSERYRASRAAGAGALASGDEQWLGYAALVLPAAYAQLRGAMAAAAARIPGWAPASMLDLGSGPGTALWAAAAQWPSLHELAAWEREPTAIVLGRKLAAGSANPALRAARWERLDLRALDHRPPTTDHRRPEPRAPSPEPRDQQTTDGPRSSTPDPRPPPPDLVVLGHVLNELEPEARQQVVAAAWALADGLLLIVEPGTPEGFAVVRAAREQLLAQGARTIAPCTHDQPCPLEGDWCHFPQRLRRPDFQRRARDAPSPWEDSKFAYAAMARFAPESPIWGRVIREATSNKAYAEVKVSSVAGVARYRALKRSREAFRQVKTLEWGATLGEPLPEEVAPFDQTTDDRRAGDKMTGDKMTG